MSQTFVLQDMRNPTGLPKPKHSSACNSCGYCCTAEPCKLAQTLLNSVAGPCVALEVRGGRSGCGLVRNPIAYLFKAANPDAEVPVLEAAPDHPEGPRLSVQFASMLGLGMGCDSDDEDVPPAWR